MDGEEATTEVGEAVTNAGPTKSDNVTSSSSSSDDMSIIKPHGKNPYLKSLRELAFLINNLLREKDEVAELISSTETKKVEKLLKEKDDLAEEINGLKTEKVELQTKIKQLCEEFQLQRASLEEEVSLLKEQGRRNEDEICKLKALNESLKMRNTQDKREATTSKGEICLEDDNNLVCDDVQSLCEEQADESPNESGENSGDKMKGKPVLVESDDTKRPKVVNQTKNANPNSVDDHIDTGNISNNQEVPQEDSFGRGTHAPIPPWKSRRVLWSNEEVEKLKEGVEIYSKSSRKNLPWKMILQFGSGTFNSSRTTSDLKDKWRNIMKKEFVS